MGRGKFAAVSDLSQSDGFSTSVLLLSVLNDYHPSPLSTYQLGLWVKDNHTPRRPISVVVKTLAQDGLVSRQSSAGKRTALWGLTERGLCSISKRAGQIRLAQLWISENPALGTVESHILRRLLDRSTISPNDLLREGFLLSPVRTAIKRLRLRDYISASPLIHGGYTLTSCGRAVAKSQGHSNTKSLSAV